MTDFDERNKKGTRAVDETIAQLTGNNIPWSYVVHPDEWKKFDGDTFRFIDKEYKKLQRFDHENGDLYVSDKRYRCDVKSDKISVKSINGFQGDYYIVWDAGRNKCIVLETAVVKAITSRDYVKLRSEDPGFQFERLKYLPHMTLDKFIKKCKE